ncbi:hypothetical protein [Pararhodospirillum oryzae]|uniref:Uncharacterized protein n=1 Tax=Pararhodospirillum oryzae TaxID=478448 RepID=A0A512HBM8_9PROT|nr:hypothetical protein [Pararhodospirillum oryzae]GEO82851.1 hypothetical protein ROR02_29820 [Pararhodospirillum oryzae]
MTGVTIGGQTFEIDDFADDFKVGALVDVVVDGVALRVPRYAALHLAGLATAETAEAQAQVATTQAALAQAARDGAQTAQAGAEGARDAALAAASVTADAVRDDLTALSDAAAASAQVATDQAALAQAARDLAQGAVSSATGPRWAEVDTAASVGNALALTCNPPVTTLAAPLLVYFRVPPGPGADPLTVRLDGDTDSLPVLTSIGAAVSGNMVAGQDVLVAYEPDKEGFVLASNGQDIMLNPNAPTILSPYNNAMVAKSAVAVQLGPFTPRLTDDVHVSTQLVVYAITAQGGPGAVVWDSGETTTGVSAITVPSTAVALGLSYLLRVRDKGELGGWSDWSGWVRVTVAQGVRAPSITSPRQEYYVRTTDNLTVSTGSFSSEIVETFAGSRFQVSTHPDFSVLLYDSGKISGTSITIPSSVWSSLAPRTRLYLRALHEGLISGPGMWSAPVTFFNGRETFERIFTSSATLTILQEMVGSLKAMARGGTGGGGGGTRAGYGAGVRGTDGGVTSVGVYLSAMGGAGGGAGNGGQNAPLRDENKGGAGGANGAGGVGVAGTKGGDCSHADPGVGGASGLWPDVRGGIGGGCFLNGVDIEGRGGGGGGGAEGRYRNDIPATAHEVIQITIGAKGVGGSQGVAHYTGPGESGVPGIVLLMWEPPNGVNGIGGAARSYPSNYL